MRVAMVLAAGLGTRLRPLTDELPKPLVPVGDRAAIEHVAARLAKAGIERMVVNTYHLAEAFQSRNLGLPAIVLHEASILGTAGGVANARAHFEGDDLVVWNGDILADVDVGALIEARRASEAFAALSVAPRARGEGTVGLGRHGQIVRIRQVNVGDEVRGGDFLGVSCFSTRAIASLPHEGCLVGDVLGPAIARGERVTTSVFEGAWDDIGSIASYVRANLRWLERHGGVSFVHGSVDASRVQSSSSIVGAAARIEGEGSLARVIAWPNALVRAPLADAIVTTRGVVVRAG